MKNKTKKIIRIALALILIVLIQGIGITYAKYITSENATGQAEVAKWAFEIVKDGEETKNIKLVNTTNKDSLINGKIAPGTSGEIRIQLDGTGSEVDLDYVLKFSNEQNKPQNLYFTYDGERYENIIDIPIIQGKIEYDESNKVKEIIIPWAWQYQTGVLANDKVKNDQEDTQDANLITEYTFDVAVTATQSE